MKNKDKLICKWDKKMDGPNYFFPVAEHAKILNKCFKGRMNLFDELEKRGYDLTTFKF